MARLKTPELRSIYETLERLIAKENKRLPFTDAELSERLGSNGYSVKPNRIYFYRRELGIPGSPKRRVHGAG